MQTAQIMKSFGELVEQNRPDMIVVAGDVNSTMACALVGAKEGIPVAHVEAGLRSFDRSMPEEVNRIVTDSLADLLFTTEESANENLAREGVPNEKIFFTGNVMIDSLIRALDAASQSALVERLGVKQTRYGLLTLHRPANVDNPVSFSETLSALAQIAQDIPLIFPVHPRTAARVQALRIDNMYTWDEISRITAPGVWMMPPSSYIDFLGLMKSATLVITDSGGVQEETTYLGVPCLTYRENTERPVTVTHGTNRLIGTDPQTLVKKAKHALRAATPENFSRPALWDGHAAERIVAILSGYFSGKSKAWAAAAAR